MIVAGAGKAAPRGLKSGDACKDSGPRTEIKTSLPVPIGDMPAASAAERAKFWAAFFSVSVLCSLNYLLIGDSSWGMCEIYNAHSIALNASSAALGPRLSRTFS
jgi:hypothetical protein